MKQPGVTDDGCGPFGKHRERVHKFRKTENLKHFYRNKLVKACFAHDAAYSDSKDLPKRTISRKILKDRAYGIAKNCDYYRYQRALPIKVFTFFNKKTRSGVSANEQLTKELNEPLVKKLKWRKIYARFKDDWAADLVEIDSLSSKNKNVK